MKRIIAAFTALLMLFSCVDENLIDPDVRPKGKGFHFTASIAGQDFFGTGNASMTRSAADDRQRVMAGFYDLPVKDRDDLMLSVSTVDGMFGKPSPIPEEGREQAATRGALLTQLAQEPMYVMETGTRKDGSLVPGEPYEVRTTDGTTWGGEFVPNASDIVSSVIRAVYPARDSVRFNTKDQTVEYSTPATASEQCDLLYSEHETTLGHTGGDSLHLTFDHILTAVRFKIGSRQLPLTKIRSIVIDGIATEGTYSCDTHKWTVSNAGQVSCHLDFNATGAENVIINGGENTFMLLPQTLSEDAKVTIRYDDYVANDAAQGDGSGIMQLVQDEITASLSTSNTPAWEPGQCITYTLTDGNGKSEYVLEVEAPGDFGPEGGTQAVNVLSYRHVEGVRTPMRWTVQGYSSDGGKTWMNGGSSNVPKGMAISPTEGSTDVTPVNVTLFPAEAGSGTHRDFLRYETPLGYDGDAFDLSTHDYLNEPCQCTTANCYVVDAPGKYRFPTAYGNSIVDGETNGAAYNNGSFKDYHANSIKSPMIQNNGVKLSRATLVWEDVPNLIHPDSIKLVNDGNAVEFEILADNIDQGNAVIAVMDGNGEVVWSWHIWVTDEKANLAESIEAQNATGESVNFMPLTLGWCSTTNAYGSVGREAAVRITMPGHLISRASFRIRQTSQRIRDYGNNTMGNAPYYNWGRKDPFPGAKSTAVHPEDEDNVDCLPKVFYQAGADAAGLGLHSELHVEYGPNYLALLGAGAINAFNGFLTGVMIGNIYNSIKGSFVPAEAAKTGGVSVGSIRAGSENAAIEAAINESSELGFLSGYTITEDGIVMSGGTICGEVRAFHDNIIDAAGYWIVEFAPTPAFSAVVTGNTARSIISIGAFSTVVLNQSVGYLGAKSEESDFGFFDILSHSSFWEGGTDWCKEMKSHGVALADGIRKPHVLFRDPISWTTSKYASLWNAGITMENIAVSKTDPDAKVVKSIYDPCPAGYCVPSARDFSGIKDATSKFGLFGATKVDAYDEKDDLRFPSLGMRNFWSGAVPGEDATNDINDQIMFVGDQGLYWTASPAIESDDRVGAYAINFRGDVTYDQVYNDEGYVEKNVYTPRVINNLKLQQSYALPIRPVREKR